MNDKTFKIIVLVLLSIIAVGIWSTFFKINSIPTVGDFMMCKNSDNRRECTLELRKQQPFITSTVE